MSNQYLEKRLEGIRKILIGVHQASSPLSSATRGEERAAFIDKFLAQVFPPPFRFGCGDATDSTGAKSGQLDVVVELPFMPSLPLVGADNPRLYLAENIAAVVEVKSNISSQWDEALRTAAQLAPLRRVFGLSFSMGSSPTLDIPLFVAAYTGWSRIETLEKKIQSGGHIDGILVIDAGLFVSSPRFFNGGMTATGAFALWGLICCLHQATSSIKAAVTDPIAYAL